MLFGFSAAVNNTRDSRHGLGRRHHQTAVKRQADLARAIQHRENILLHRKRNIAVTGADATRKAFSDLAELRIHFLAKSVTQAFYALCAYRLHDQRLGRSEQAVFLYQSVKGSANGRREQDDLICRADRFFDRIIRSAYTA